MGNNDTDRDYMLVIGIFKYLTSKNIEEKKKHFLKRSQTTTQSSMLCMNELDTLYDELQITNYHKPSRQYPLFINQERGHYTLITGKYRPMC